MRAKSALAIVAGIAGCHLIGDFSHLRIRGDGEGGGSDCTPTDCGTLGLTCGQVAEPCAMQLMNCDTGQKDGSETDIDCGGATETCPTRCPVGRACMESRDCESGVCTMGACAAPTCGDDVINGDEACDDGNTESYDGCSATCTVEEGHLLISEAVIEDDPAEFIELHNPNDWSVNLEDYYLASTPTYYLFTTGMQPMLPEVVLGFPANSIIPPRGFVVVSLEEAMAFEAVYGVTPDFDMVGMNAPMMIGGDPAAKLDNDAGIVVLFYWDGASDLALDVDYLLYGNTSAAVDKSDVTVGGSTYADETPPGMQGAAPKVGKEQALYRCDTVESTEVAGGNGVDGDDETSEDCSRAFVKAMGKPTPRMAPEGLGPCP
jgi:cysteine-rich repeat protein